MPEDEFAKMVATFDQFGAHLRPIAALVGNFYKEAADVGVPHDVAKEMALELSRHILSHIMPPRNPLQGLLGP